MKYTDPNIGENGSIYGAWKTEFGDYIINAAFVNCYLLIGEEKAMLIDTACGFGSLRYLAEKITKLPVIVVNTHGHGDHSGGNLEWEKVFMGAGGEEEARRAEEETAKMKGIPVPRYEIETLSDGLVFDLGGRTVEAIAIGAHHRSSFAFLDRKNRSLYTGDELENGQVLLFVSGEDVPEEELVKRHLANMKKLSARKGEFDRVYPAHNGAPLSVDYIDDFIALSEKILSGEAVPEETVLGFGMPASFGGGDEKLIRIKHNKASFVMTKK